MANNQLDKVIPQLLAQGLLALREHAVTPRLVANHSSKIAGKKGSTLDVPIPSAVECNDVVPANVAPNSPALLPDTVPVVLDQWKEAPFEMDDKEYGEVMDGTIPMQASEAIKSIVNAVDKSLISAYRDTFSYAGTEGSIPYDPASGTNSQGTGASRRVRLNLNKQLAPMSDRRVLLNPDAEDQALDIRAFQDTSFNGTNGQVISEGVLGRRFGMDHFMNQNMPNHTAGVKTGATVTINGAQAVPAASNSHQSGGTISLASAGAAAIFLAGDLFEYTVGGKVYSHTILADVTVPSGGNTAVSVYPALEVAVAGGEAVTTIGDHSVNLGFHRDAIAFANRPLLPAVEGLGAMSATARDPISGLSLRLEVTRQHKRTRWAFDFLWGYKMVRRELATRLIGTPA